MPNLRVVLYGDFFNDTVNEAIKQEVPTQDLRDVFPEIDYTSDLDADIISGLFALALSNYKYGVREKNHPWNK